MKHSNDIFKFSRRLEAMLRSARLVYFYFILSLALPNILLAITEDFTPIERCANVLLPLGIYIFIVSISRRLGRTIWILLPLILMGAMQIVLLKLYGRSIIAVDMLLNLTSTNPGEAGELLGSLFPIVIFVCVLYLPSLIMGVWMMVRKVELPRHFTFKGRVVAYCVTGVGAICTVLCFVTDRSYAMRRDLYPVNVAYNISLATKHTGKLMKREALSRDFHFSGVELHPDSLREVYVLVVGETSRADHWQINGYRRPTNPKLSQRDDVFSFRRAMSESNTTHKSVPLILSHLDSSTYGDSIYVVKSIISLFREAGFKTAFISNQQRNGSFIDFFGEEADTTIFLKDKEDAPGKTGYDLDLAAELDKILSQRAHKQLVVLHCYGSHFNYSDRYPEQYRKFVPDAYVEASRSEKEKLVNAYDNTILLTDDLLSRVIERIEDDKPDMAAMIYTSDHGEDLYDDDRDLFLHASPCPSFYQLRVPFLVWLSPGYVSVRPHAAMALRSNIDKKVSSSRSFFDTATRLAGIRTTRSSCPDNLASMRYREPERTYLDDHNRMVTLSECGFERQDLDCLRRLDISRFAEAEKSAGVCATRDLQAEGSFSRREVR